MASDDSESTYKIKRIPFLGRDHVPILCQNLNGPCPLLAIANVLSLRNELPGISSTQKEITNGALMSMVAERILDGQPSSSMRSAEFEANLRANIEDALHVLRKLGSPGNTGMDVNIRFDSPFGFEATREVAVFDLLGIPLAHAWLVDPQDTITAAALGTKTYNQAVEMLISGLDSNPASFSAPQPPNLQPHSSTDAATAHAPTSSTSPNKHTAVTEDLIAALAKDAGGSSKPSQPGEFTDTELALFKGLAVNDTTSPMTTTEEPPDSPPPTATTQFRYSLPSTSIPVTAGGPEPAQSSTAADTAPTTATAATTTANSTKPPVLDVLAVRDFMDRNASQATVYGLSQLHAQINENALTVFFRNNHFNCLFKHEGALFQLITDQGYLSVPEVVWERLDTVDGDTELCGPDFLPHKAKAQVHDRPSQAQLDMEALNAAIPPGALDGLDEADAAAIAEAAGVFLPHTQVVTTHAEPLYDSGAVAAAPVANHDADLALALQLQQEEERAAAREMEAREHARLQNEQHAAALAAEQYQRQQYQQQHLQLQQQQQQQYQQQPAQRTSAGRPSHPQQYSQQQYGTTSSQSHRLRPPAAAAANDKDKSSCNIM